MIPAERHNEEKVHLKALPEQIFVVFFQTEKSSTRKKQFPSDTLLGHVCQNVIVNFHQSCFRIMKFPVCRLEDWILK